MVEQERANGLFIACLAAIDHSADEVVSGGWTWVEPVLHDYARDIEVGMENQLTQTRVFERVENFNSRHDALVNAIKRLIGRVQN